MALSKLINKPKDELQIKKEKLLSEINFVGLQMACGKFCFANPEVVPLAVCDECGVIPMLQLIPSSQNPNNIKYQYHCPRCKKTSQDHLRTQPLAAIHWNFVNLKSQDYRKIKVFKLANMSVDDAYAYMVKVRQSLEHQVLLCEIDFALNQGVADKGMQSIDYRIMMKFKHYLHWALLAQRILSYQKKLQTKDHC